MFEGLFQPLHLLILLFILLIIFGPGKLPELGEGLGKSIKAFKRVISDKEDTSAVEKKDKKSSGSAEAEKRTDKR